MPTVFSKEINVPPESNSFSSSSSSSSSSTNNQKVPQISKKSVGNQHRFAQQTPSKKLKSCGGPDQSFANSEVYQDMVLEQVVDKLSTCCASGTRYGFGCLLSLFRAVNKSSDLSAESFTEEYMDCSRRAVEYVKECRKLGVADNPLLSERENRDKFLQEVYRECLVDVQEFPDGKSKHVMRYCIPAINQKLGRLHKPEVCLPTLRGVYGFTEYDWRICSQAIKSNPTGRVSSLRHKVWKDDKLPEHSYAEMEVVFRENLKTTKEGEEPVYSKAGEAEYCNFCLYIIIIKYAYYSFRSQNDSGRINPYGRNTASVHSLAITIFRIVWG